VSNVSLTFATPVLVHPDRTGARKSGPNRVIVVHDSEGSEGDRSAANLAQYMTTPGDRPNGSGGVYGSSYQAVADARDLGRPAGPRDVVAYSASGANHDGDHICIPGKASQTRAMWLDDISRQYIRTTALYIVESGRQQNIPSVRLSVAQVRDGRSRGYCSHHDVSLAFGKSTHTDPGPQFPWDVLAADIAEALGPPPGEWTMATDLELRKPPLRLLDSRWFGGDTGRVGDKRPGDTGYRTITVGEAAGAVAVEVTLTLVDARHDGFVTAWDQGGKPDVSSVNVSPGTPTAANTTVVPVTSEGKFQVFVAGDSHLLVDLLGVWR
jgi:hypothetical protein